MSRLAERTSVEAIWRPLTDEESSIVDGLLDQASTKLRALVPRVDDLASGSVLMRSLAHDAVVNAVVRRLGNPSGLLTESIDDYSYRRDSATSSGKLYIDLDDIVGLLPPPAKRRSKFRMIRLRAGI